MSARRYLSNSAGVMMIGTAPCLAQASFVSALGQRLVDLGVELVDDRLRRAGRRHDAEPDGGLVARQAGLGDGRHVRQHGRARRAGGAERPHLAGLDVRRHGGDGVEHHLHVAADGVGARFAAAAVRHMHDVGVAHGFEQLAGHVIGRAGPRRGIVELARLGLQQRHELLQVLGRHGRVHHHHQVGVVDRRHRHEVAHQVERLGGDQRLVDGVGVRHHQQRVAVGRRLGDLVGAGDRAGARPVLDHERLLEGLLQMLADEARIDVGRAAGAERHDDLDRRDRDNSGRQRGSEMRRQQRRQGKLANGQHAFLRRVLFSLLRPSRIASDGIHFTSMPTSRPKREILLYFFDVE